MPGVVWRIDRPPVRALTLFKTTGLSPHLSFYRKKIEKGQQWTKVFEKQILPKVSSVGNLNKNL